MRSGPPQGGPAETSLVVLAVRFVEQAAEDVGGFPVGLGEEVGVDVQGRRGVAVAEAAGDRANVDAGGEESGGDVVAEVVVIPRSG